MAKKKWSKMTEEERLQFIKEYTDFMWNPNNANNCNSCPSSRGYKGGGIKPCGQFTCWVTVHFSNREEMNKNANTDL